MPSEQQRRWMVEIRQIRERLTRANGLEGPVPVGNESLHRAVGYTVGQLHNLLADWGEPIGGPVEKAIFWDALTKGKSHVE